MFHPRERKAEAALPGLDTIRDIIEVASTAIVVIDTERQIFYMNRVAQALWGDKKGQPCHVALRGSSEVCSDCPLDQVIRGTRVEKRGMRMKTAGGSVLHENIFIPLSGYGKQTRFVALISADPGELKLLEREVFRERTLRNAIIESVNTLVIGIDTAGKVTFVNRATEAVTGYSEAEIIRGGGFKVLLPEGERSHADGFVRSVISEAGERTPVSIRLLTKSGEARSVSWTYTPLVGPGGKTEGAVCLGQDVTDSVSVQLETGRRASELEIVNTILSKTSLITSIEELFGDLIDRLIHLMGYRCGAACMLEGEGATVRVAASRGFRNPLPERYPVHAELFPATAVFASDIEVVGRGDVMDPAALAIIEAEGLNGAVTIPLISGGHAYGGLVLGFDRDKSAVEGERGTLKGVGEAVSLVAENARLRARSEEQAREATALLRVAQSVAGSRELNSVLSTIVEEAAQLLKVDRSGIFLFDSEGETLTRVAWYGIDADENASLRVKLDELRSASEVARTLKPFAVYDISEDDEANRALVETYGLRGMLVAPLLRDGDLIGVLNMVMRTPRQFTKREVELAESFARQAATAIHNARLIEDLAQSEERYRGLVESTEDIVFNMDTDGTITFMNESVYPMLGYKPEEVVGHKGAEIVAPGRRGEVAAWDSALLAGEKLILPDIWVTSKDGRRALINVQLNPRKIGGRVFGVTGTARDVTEQHRAEAALSESEKKYRGFVENFEGIAFRGDANFAPEFFHGAVEKICGYTEEDFTSGRVEWGKLIHPDDLPGYLSEIERDMSSGGGFSGIREFRLVRKSGEVAWLRELMHSVNDDSGIPVGAEGVIYDVTDLRNAEAALRESEERYRTLVDNSLMGIFVHDGKDLLYMNDRVAEITGFPKENFTRFEQVLELLVPDERPVITDRVAHRLAGEEAPRVYDTRIRRADGSIARLQLMNTAATLGGKRVIIVEFTDVTDRYNAEEAVRASEQRYRALVESSEDAILIVDPRGTVLFANPASARVGRMPPDRVIGTNVFDLIHPDELESAKRKSYAAWKQGKPIARFPMRVLTGGEERDLEATSTLLGKPGPGTNTMLIVRDVTERLRAERELAESEERYRTIVETTQEAIVTLNRAGEILYANPAFKLIFDTDPGTATGRNIFRFVDPEDREAISRELAEAFRSGTVRPNVPIKGLKEGGSRIHLEVSPGLIGWPGEEAVAIVVLRDVTERRHREVDRELQLKVEEARATITSRFVDPGDLHLAIRDTLENVGKLLGVSHAYYYDLEPAGETAAEILAWSAEGVSETPELEFGAEEVRSWREALLKGSDVVISDIEEIPDDTERQALKSRGIRSAVAQPVFLRDRLVGALGFSDAVKRREWSVHEANLIRDIGATISRALERREWVENLARSERFRTRITESIGEGLFVAKDRIITWANRRASEIYGYGPEEMVGKSTEFMYPDRQAFKERGGLVYSALEETGRYSAETRLKRKDGTLFDAAVSIRSLGREYESGGEVVVAVTDITESKRMRDEVEAAAEAYSTLFSAAGDALIVHAPEGEIRDANERACSYTGYTREELLNMNIKDLVPEEREPSYEPVIEKLKRGGSAVFETVFAQKDGGLLPIEVTARQTNIWGENVILSSQRDITERKRAEEQTRHRAQQLAALNEIVKAATSSLDPNIIVGAILGVAIEVIGGDGGATILETPTGKGKFAVVAYQGLEDGLVDVLDDSDVKTALVEAVSAEPGSRVIRTSGPNVLPGLEAALPPFGKAGVESIALIPLKSGEVLMGVMILTSRVRDTFNESDMGFCDAAGAEIGVSLENAFIYRELAAEHERLSLLYRSAQSISGDVDLDSLLATTAEQAAKSVGALSALVALVEPAYGEFVWKAAYNLDLGKLSDMTLSLKEGLGGAIFETKKAVLFPSEQYGEDKLKDEPVVRTFGFTSGVVVPLISGDKVVGALGVHEPRSAGPVGSEDVLLLEAIGRQAGVAIENVMLYDETKKHLDALERAHQELMELDRMKSDFVSTVSHELRSPLAVIEGFASTLVENFDRIDPEIQKESVEIILKKSMALEGLIENILDMSRIEGGRLDVALEEVDLLSICESVRADEQRVSESYKITLEGPEGEIRVLVDSEKAQMALGNLLRNAVKFSPEGETVTIVARVLKGAARVSVTDCGIGIPTEELERIFDRFYQVDSGETRAYPGTGLGLYITRELMHAMGGEVSVESEHGKGSTFHLDFPMARGQGRATGRK